MKKTVQGLQIKTENLILVKELNSIQIFRTTKYQYIMVAAGKYTWLKDQYLIDISKSMNFKIEQYEKNNFYIHASLKESEHSKFEKFKNDYGLNTNNAIKKLIDNI